MNNLMCDGCNRVFKTKKILKKHMKTSKECNVWINILKNSYNKSLAKKIDDIHTDPNYGVRKLECTACNSTFCNIGNFNKHFNNRPICRKLVDWEKFKLDNNNISINQFTFTKRSKREIKKIEKIINLQ